MVKRGRCSSHERARRKEDDAHRGSRHQRGYDAEWDALRVQILERDQYLCQVGRGRPGCLVDASQVDHIVPLADGGSHSPTNLQAICTACHGRKTGSERAERRRGRATQGGVNSFQIDRPGPPPQPNARAPVSGNVPPRGR